MPWAVAPTLAGVRADLTEMSTAWEADSEYHFSFFFGRRLVGSGGINRLTETDGDGARPAQAEIHYWMHSSFAGRGLATEASRAMLSFAFDSLHIEEVVLLAGEKNHGSLRVAEKLGFAHERTSPDGLAGSDGPFPTHHHRLRRADHSRLRSQQQSSA